VIFKIRKVKLGRVQIRLGQACLNKLGWDKVKSENQVEMG